MTILDSIMGAIGLSTPASAAPQPPSSTIPKLAVAIKAVAPSSMVHPQDWADALSPFMVSSGITTPHRIAAFVGQVSRESAGFSTVTENLNYSAARLLDVWPTHFTHANFLQYANQPEKIANRAYADRMGNGDEASGDGWRYRGAGLIQLTGKANQMEFAVDCHIEGDVGDYLRTLKGAAQSACWFWSKRNLNPLADAWAITHITQLVNGGITDATNRVNLANAAMKAMSAT